MSELVTLTLQRIFARPPVAPVVRDKAPALMAGEERLRRPDFAETRPVVFRSEAFAEDLAASGV